MGISKALIPLGGLGTRLYPLTVETSKAMVRFLNRHLIDYIIMKLAQNNIREIYLGVSGYFNYRDLYDHLGSVFTINFPSGKELKVRVRYQPNIDSIGNAHSVKILMEYYDIKEPVIVVQGDTVFDLGIDLMYKFHRENEGFMTIALKPLEDPRELRHFGVAKLGEDGKIIEGFVEKPETPDKAPSNLVNTGIYLLSEEFREYLESPVIEEKIKKKEMDFGKNIIPDVISCGKRVLGYMAEGYWFDIGTPERYLEATFTLLRVLSNDELGVTTEYKNVRMQGKTRLSKKLHADIIKREREGKLKLIGDILLGRHISIGDNVELNTVVIDNYTIIGSGTRIVNSVVMDRNVIGENVVIENSIIGRHVKIGRNAMIINSYVGNNVVIGEGAVLERVKVWPHKTIEAHAYLGNVAIK
ncbi:MAG: NDP-sugar synthase [Thermoprotei archaeon]